MSSRLHMNASLCSTSNATNAFYITGSNIVSLLVIASGYPRIMTISSKGLFGSTLWRSCSFLCSTIHLVDTKDGGSNIGTISCIIFWILNCELGQYPFLRSLILDLTFLCADLLFSNFSYSGFSEEIHLKLVGRVNTFSWLNVIHPKIML